MKTQEVLDYIETLDDQVELRAIRFAADKKVKAHNSELVTTANKRREAAPEAKDIAQYLLEEVNIRYPFLKSQCATAWANEIDKLHRLDGYDWSIIKGVAEWSQDDSFWRQQIRSGANLRKHFEKMLVKINESETLRMRVFKV